MTVFVQVAVNVSHATDVFDYHLPPELEGRVQIGHLVEVPFGRQLVQAVVLRFAEFPAVSQTRPVSSLLDAQAVLTPLQIALAQRMAHDSLASLADCIRLMLPSGLSQQADLLYTPLLRPPGGGGRPLTPLQSRLTALLEKRGPLRGRQIDQALPRQNWRAAARSLIRSGRLAAAPVLPEPSVRPKRVRNVSLACSPAEARQAFSRLGRPGSPAQMRRQAALEFLLREPEPVEASWVYAESGSTPADLRRLAELGLVRMGETESLRDPLSQVQPAALPIPRLTSEQRRAWSLIQAGIAEARSIAPPPYLLHGVTSSGKTELYLQAVQATLQAGRQAIVLVPEIALTPQTVQRFAARFPGQVGLLHSQLSEGERYDTWRRARAGEIRVVVGPRSALFTPFTDPGLVVVDECHDDSYYQGDPPHYDARQAALHLAELAKAVCIFGSATPDLTQTYQAAQGRWRYARLTRRVQAHSQAAPGQSAPELPPVRVIDMREELKAGNRSIFSRPLQAALEAVLGRGQQAILYLNRRGTATHVFCRDCGLVLKCPRCDLPLTYHGPEQALLCHRCGYRRGMPHTCPNCKSSQIRQFGAGTERVEAEVQKLFPQARTLRWDYETTRKKGAHAAILDHFAAHRADVLVGTQMLAKGLDLPLVTLVGVVLADVGLNLPDYAAAERTFQLLTQVAGRAGRSPLGGEVILQTFEPGSYALQAAAAHSYRQFYQRELEYRRQLGYPPFARLARLEIRHPDPSQAEAAAVRLADQIHEWIETEGYRATEVIGPAPCFFSRLAGQYRWQIVLRGPDPASLLRGRRLPDWRVEIDPPSLL